VEIPESRVKRPISHALANRVSAGLEMQTTPRTIRRIPAQARRILVLFFILVTNKGLITMFCSFCKVISFFRHLGAHVTIGTNKARKLTFILLRIDLRAPWNMLYICI
jgi:hypothetical protein